MAANTKLCFSLTLAMNGTSKKLNNILLLATIFLL